MATTGTIIPERHHLIVVIQECCAPGLGHRRHQQDHIHGTVQFQLHVKSFPYKKMVTVHSIQLMEIC